jgi:hypothetical protein
MAVPESKNELIEAINKNYPLLIKKLMSVPAQKVFEPLMQGHVKGSAISAAQLVSCLIGWGALVLSLYAHSGSERAENHFS